MQSTKAIRRAINLCNYMSHSCGKLKGQGELGGSEECRRYHSNDVDDARAESAKEREKEGGREQQRHPGLGEEAPAKPQKPRQLDLLGLDRDDADPAIDKRAMDQARTNTLVRAHAINQSRGDDAVPEF